MPEMERFRLAAELIMRADALLITAGAGMGVDSGLPDFRGQEGFWRAYPAIARLGLSFAEIAEPSWFTKDPCLAWAFYGHRLNLYRTTQPHAGFARLLALGRTKRNGCFVFTSNVDGQFQRAGFPPECVVECHGSIHHLQCLAGCRDEIWPADEERVMVNEAEFRAVEPLPRCPFCGGLARPNVLMFGDGSWLGHRTQAQQARFSDWINALRCAAPRLVVVEIGAGSAIPTVRQTSEWAATKLGAILIRINPRASGVAAGHLGLACGAAEAMDRIWAAVPAMRPPRSRPSS
jgi:NAD-dependent SIR2 family protein deacetylase